MNLRHAGRFAAIILLAGVAVSAQARDPFHLRIEVDDDAANASFFGFPNIEDAIDQIDPDQLAARYPTASTGKVEVDFDFRGLQAFVGFETEDVDPDTLTFRIKGVKFNNGMNEIKFTPRSGNPQVEFLAASTNDRRSDALDQLKDYLKENKDALKALLTALARFTPIDPLAGNPDSLFGRQMRANFDQGFTHKVSQIWGCGSTASNSFFGQGFEVAQVGDSGDIFRDAQERQAALMAQNEFGIGLYAASTTAEMAPSPAVPGGGEVVSNSLTIPISYTAKLDSDPRRKIRFDLPLTAVDTEGAMSYGLGLGLSYTHPLSDEWTLTPAVGAGVTGSEDLGSAGGATNYSITSAYTWRLDSFAISMGNAVGRYESLALKIGDIEAEADIANTVFTNGLMFTGPNSLIAKNMVVEYSIVDTRITGDEVYTDGYDEIGVAVGFFDTEMGVIDSFTKIGLGYLFGDGASGDINSLRLNVSSRF